MSGSDHLVPALGASSASSMPKAPTKPPPLSVKPLPWSSRSAFEVTSPTLPTFTDTTSPSFEMRIDVFSAGSQFEISPPSISKVPPLLSGEDRLELPSLLVTRSVVEEEARRAVAVEKRRPGKVGEERDDPTGEVDAISLSFDGFRRRSSRLASAGASSASTLG